VKGMGFLIALREDLLACLRYQRRQQQQQTDEANETANKAGKAQQQQQQACYRDLDGYLRKTFEAWFAPGLLRHERITYESTPAKIIEEIATREAVHPMKSLEDLRNRLGSSRRVFALFHPSLPGRPLVFVHVALLAGSSGVPSSMGDVMATDATTTANDNRNSEDEDYGVAAFYSISNGVRGLAGVGLGEFLLKETIRALKEELPSIETFVTLSPVPGFRKWVRVRFLAEEQRQRQRILQTLDPETGQDDEETSSLLSGEDRDALHRCGLVSSASPFPWNEFVDALEATDFAGLMEAVENTTDGDVREFLSDRAAAEDNDKSPPLPPKHRLRQQCFVLRGVLLKLVSRYLALEKHRGKPLDKVCGFHVGNGAELHKVRFGADLSRGGLSNSYGLMVNYLYRTESLAKNQANFESSGFVVPVGEGVREWLE